MTQRSLRDRGQLILGDATGRKYRDEDAREQLTANCRRFVGFSCRTFLVVPGANNLVLRKRERSTLYDAKAIKYRDEDARGQNNWGRQIL